VAFNPGVREAFIDNVAYEDYTAGEVADFLPVATVPSWHVRLGRTVQGAQFHVLSFIGPYWRQGPPRFPDELIIGYTKHVNSYEGVITWDVPHTPEGHIPEEFMRQLGVLRDATR